MSIATGGISFGSSGGGGGGGTVTSVSASTPLASSGGTTPTISIAPAGQTQGDILYFNGTTWVRLPAGTSGQFLKTNGNAANPAWAANSVTNNFLVFDPTGTAGDNVYTSFALLATAAAAISGPKNIFIRLRQADFTVPSGSYNFGYDPTFIGDGDDAGGGFSLIFPTGATMADLPHLTDVVLSSTSTANIVSVAAPNDKVYVLQGLAGIATQSSGTFYHETAGRDITVELYGQSSLSDNNAGPSPRCITGEGSVFVNMFDFSACNDNSFWGTSATGANILSPSVNLSLTQAGGAALTVNILTLAQLLGYSPAVSANWTTVPTQTKAALDSLAARAVASGNTASRPASPVTGQYYFDTTLGIPIWRNGSNWVNAAGVTV